MIIGIALVVDELHKGQRLVYRYPESVPSSVLNAQEQLLKFHRDYLSLSADHFAKLFRPKAALFNKVLELTIDDLHYISFPCPCSDELSSDSSSPTGTDVITLFNVVIATLRESTVKALLAKTQSVPDHGDPSRGLRGGAAAKVGADPVAFALGLGGTTFKEAVRPKLLRRVVETVSRALLHQEKRNRYVSKQVTLMLRLQELHSGGGPGATTAASSGAAAAAAATVSAAGSSSSGASAAGGGASTQAAGSGSGGGGSGAAGAAAASKSSASPQSTGVAASQSGKGNLEAKRRMSLSGQEPFIATRTRGASNAPPMAPLPGQFTDVVQLAVTGSATVGAAAGASPTPSVPATAPLPSLTLGAPASAAAAAPAPALAAGGAAVATTPGGGIDATPAPDAAMPLAASVTASTPAPAAVASQQEKNLHVMEVMQQQCGLANELRQIYHGLVGGHSVNLMVNGTLSINIRLQDTDDAVDAAAAVAMDDVLGDADGDDHASVGHLTFLTIAEREAMLPLFSSINSTSQPTSLAPFFSPTSSSSSASSSASSPAPPPSSASSSTLGSPAGGSAASPLPRAHIAHLHPHMQDLVLALDPTMSLDDLSGHLGQPLADVADMCRHLRTWGFGRFVAPVTAERRYMVHRDARLHPHSKAARTFASVFAEPLRLAAAHVQEALNAAAAKGPSDAASEDKVRPLTRANSSRNSLSNLNASLHGRPASLASLSASTHGRSSSMTTVTATAKSAAAAAATAAAAAAAHAAHAAVAAAQSAGSPLFPAVDYSLPCVLSVFDGHRTLESAVSKLPAPAQPFAVDMVIWLLRWGMLEEVHVYLATPCASLGDVAAGTAVYGRHGSFGASVGSHAAALAAAAAGTAGAGRARSLRGGPSSSVALSGAGDGGAVDAPSPFKRSSSRELLRRSSSREQLQAGVAGLVQLSEAEWDLCTRLWPYVAALDDDDDDDEDDGRREGTKPPAGIRASTLSVHEIAWREGVLEDEVVKVVRKLPAYFSLFYC